MFSNSNLVTQNIAKLQPAGLAGSSASDILCEQALEYALTNNLPKFNSMISQSLKLDPMHLPTLMLSASYLMESREFDKSEYILKKILEIEPNNKQGQKQYCILLTRRNASGDAEKAEEIVQTLSSSTDPQDISFVGTFFACK